MSTTQSQNGDFFDNTFYAWGYALVPTVKSYEEILSLFDENSRLKITLIWTVISYSFAMLLFFVYIILFEGFGKEPSLRTSALVVVVVFVSLIYVVVGIVFLIVPTGISHFIATRLGGEASFASMIFMYSSSFSPMVVLSMIMMLALGKSPPVSHVCVVLNIYQFVLLVNATKAVHKLNWFKSIVVSLPVLLVSFGEDLLSNLYRW
ncbi:MAG: YIP1 family protein [Anaerolineae bacterium]|nr:YIP1 family protein [Anaerolineae bacterium]